MRRYTQSPHLSHKMARCLSRFADYNCEVQYKLGKQNLLATALARRPDYELSHVTIISSPVTDLIRTDYAKDEHCVALLRALESESLRPQT